MEAWMWIVIIVIAVLVVIAIVAMLGKRRSHERRDLQDRFGGEYDRKVEEADSRRDRRKAEGELQDRAERRDKLEIRELPAEARTRYMEQWHGVQERFVDQPGQALSDADELIRRVMRDRGYPADDIDERTDMVSVDHPNLVERFRSGRAVQERVRTSEATTEEMRRGMVDYRSLFDELIGHEPAGAVRPEQPRYP